MNTLQENRLSMYLAVRDFLLRYPVVTKDLPGFSENFMELQKLITDIQSIAEIQKSGTKGHTLQKRSLREELIRLTLDTSYKINAFAKLSQDLKLQEDVKMTRARLNRATDTGLRDFARIICEKAESNLESLKGYGVTNDKLAIFLDAIQKYNASISGPRIARTEILKATRQLEVLFDNAGDMIENIESVIGIVRYSQPDFINGFRGARKVVNNSSGSLALKGYAFDARSGNAIKGVKFVFRNQNGIIAPGTGIVKTTAAKGGFIIRSMAQGTYTVIVSKPGYRERTVTVVVANGEKTELRVELEGMAV